jgi:hypothetical protein
VSAVVCAALCAGASSAEALTVNVPLGGSIPQAVASVGAAGGGTVVLGPGIYYTNSSIDTFPNTTVEGQGPSTIIEPAPQSAGINVFEGPEGDSNITIKNLVVDGEVHRNTFLVNESGGKDNPFGGVDFYFFAYNNAITNLTIENVTASDGGQGLLFGTAVGARLINDTFIDNNPGASFAHDAYCVACWDLTINNSRFDYSNGDGLHIDFTSQGGDDFTHSEFSHDSGEGILFQGGMVGNTVSYTSTDFDGDDGIDLDSVDSNYDFLRGEFDGEYAILENGEGPDAINGQYGIGDGGGFPGIYEHGVSLSNFATSSPPANTYWAPEAEGVVGPNPTADWSTSIGGYSNGIGEVDFNGYPNGKLTFNVGDVSSGSTEGTLRYRNTTSSTETMALTVNGQSAGNISFAPTGESWGTASFTMPLKEGNNVVVVNAESGGAPALDYLHANLPTPAAPAAPANVTATATGPYQVDLNWSPVAGAQNYVIVRNGRIIANNIVANHYTDIDFSVSGSSASYTVDAVNQGGYSTSATVSATTPPDSPAGLHITGTSSEGTGLEWMSVNGASSYNVKRSTVEGGPYTTIANVTNTTSPFSTNFWQTYTDKTATSGVKYYYVISSVYAGGESPNSYEFGSSITPIKAYPGDGQVTLDWDGPQASESSPYEVVASPGGQSCTSTSVTSCTVTGLTDGQTYTFAVTGDGGQSANVTATPYPASVMSSSNGLSLWLDGADPSTEYTSPSCAGQTAQAGQAIGCWADKSGSGDNFNQWAPGSQPSLGSLSSLGAINFTSAAQTQSLGAAGTATYETVFIAAQSAATSSGFDELFGQSNADFGIREAPANSPGPLASPNANDWATGTGSPALEWTNGVQATEASAGKPAVIAVQSASPKTIAATIGDYDLARGLVGQIGEVVAFQGTLTTAQREAVERYLAKKWGASLGSTNAAPVVTTQPKALTLKEGEAITFTATASGTPAPSVQWQVSFNNGSSWNELPGATSTSENFGSSYAAQNGALFRAVFTNSAGSVTTSSALLTVGTAPAITTQPSSTTVTEGATATFTAAASGNPAPTVQWQLSTNGGSSWANISGATSVSYTTAATTTANSGYEYRAVFTNSISSATTSAATLTVKAVTVAPKVETQPTALTVKEGEAVTFSAAASGSPTPSVQWEVSSNGGASWSELSGDTSTSLSLGAATAAQNGELFRAKFTNSAGTATSNTALLTVKAATSAPVVTTQPQPLTLKEGEAIVFSASASGTPAPSLQWEASFNGGSTWGPLVGATSSPFNFGASYAAQNGALFRATFTNSAGSVTTNAVLLTVDYAPSILTQPSSTTVTEGATATFTAGASGNPVPTVQWQLSTNSGSSWSAISGATSTSYTTAATTTANSGYEYRAVFTNSVSSATSSAATLTVKSSSGAPTVTTQPSALTIKEGEAIVFSAAASGSPAPSLQWEASFNGGSTWNVLTGATSSPFNFGAAYYAQNGALFRATFTNSAGSATTNAVLLTVYYAPSVTTQPASTTVSEGATATFTAAASGNPAPTVQWQLSTNSGSSWSNISGATSTSYTTAATTTANSGYEYRAVFTNSVSSATSSAATLTVKSSAVAPTVTTQPTALTLKAGEEIVFSAAASGTPAPSIQWEDSFNGGSTWVVLSGATHSPYDFGPSSASQNGQILRATFTNSAGSVTTNGALLTVDYAPSISTQPASTTVKLGASATFTAAASGNPAPTVQWQQSTNSGSSWSNISGATSTTYTISKTTITQNGYEYRAVFTNSLGSATTSAAKLSD